MVDISPHGPDFDGSKALDANSTSALSLSLPPPMVDAFYALKGLSYWLKQVDVLIFRASLVLVTSMGISYDQHTKNAINDNEGEVEIGEPHD